jgi:tetratricopeptide (TPR) repeat protein
MVSFRFAPFLRAALALLLAAPTLALANPGRSTPPEEALKALAARQRDLLDRASKKTSQEELEDLRQPLQSLCFDYEDFLRRHPGIAAGYVAYAMLLDHPIIDERRRATGLLLRANQIDPELALVKNQLGNHVAEEGRPLEALNYYLAAIRLEPKEPLYHYQLGTLLAEAGDAFVTSGEWTRPKLDEALLRAFSEAMRLSPNDWRYAYRYGLAYYDVEKPDWTAALAFWTSFESHVQPGIEQQTCRLHQARIQTRLGRSEEARRLLGTVDAAPLARQRDALLAEIDRPAAP